MPHSRFLKVACECGNESVVFDRASKPVRCAACNAVLAEPAGGRAHVKAKVVKSLG
jgi:small subunit ribosomal protein S27e